MEGGHKRLLDKGLFKQRLEKAMATHSSIHAWRIPWTEESGRLQSRGAQKSRISDLTHTNTRILWTFQANNKY